MIDYRDFRDRSYYCDWQVREIAVIVAILGVVAGVLIGAVAAMVLA